MRPYWQPRALYAEVHIPALQWSLSYIPSGLGLHTERQTDPGHSSRSIKYRIHTPIETNPTVARVTLRRVA